MGLRIDPLATRRRIRDALAADVIPTLGPAPNVFGDSGRILGLGEEKLQEQQDRYRIVEATPQGWVSNVTGTGQRVHLASRDISFVAAPWTARPWVWPNDAVVEINGTEASIDRSKVEELGWSQLGQQLTVGFDVTTPVTQHPSDVVTVTIPDSDWMLDYLDGSKHVRLDHLDGSTYYAYDQPDDSWEQVTLERRVDADVLSDRDPSQPVRQWVAVGAIDASLDVRVMTGYPVGYSAELEITVGIGSGPQHNSPDEADTVAFKLLDQILDVVGKLERLPDTGRIAPTEATTVQAWHESDDCETILELKLSVESI